MAERENFFKEEIQMYSPKIQPEQVRKLYLLKISYASININKSMTQIVQDALDEYIPKVAKKIIESGGAILKPEELGIKEV